MFAFLRRLFGKKPPPPTEPTLWPPLIQRMSAAPEPAEDLDPPSRWTPCPVHGHKHLSYYAFQEHTGHRNGFNHFHTVYHACHAPDCKVVVADEWAYYEKVHEDQIRDDMAWADEYGREFYVPVWRRPAAGPVPEGDDYRLQGPSC